jgi:hypothetical protein
MTTLGLFDPLYKNTETVPYVRWKNRTFQQVTSTLQNNAPRTTPMYMNSNSGISPNLLVSSNKNNIQGKTYITVDAKKKRPLPLKHYRREIATAPTSGNNCNSRASIKIDDFDRPNGYLVNNTAQQWSNILGSFNALDIKANNVKLGLAPGCSNNLNQNGVCFDAGRNALKRVRSSGMIVKKSPYVAPFNSQGQINLQNPDKAAYNAPYSTSAQQYMYSRGKTFQQNQSAILVSGSKTDIPGSAGSINNRYRVPSTNFCSNPLNPVTGQLVNYLPTAYKPRNWKFASQGGVSASDRLLRLKYNTLNTTAGIYTNIYGNSLGNSIAYGSIFDPYTIKTKIGNPGARTPIFPKSGTASVKCCNNTISRKNPV